MKGMTHPMKPRPVEVTRQHRQENISPSSHLKFPLGRNTVTDIFHRLHVEMRRRLRRREEMASVNNVER